MIIEQTGGWFQLVYLIIEQTGIVGFSLCARSWGIHVGFILCTWTLTNAGAFWFAFVYLIIERFRNMFSKLVFLNTEHAKYLVDFYSIT